MKFGIAICLLAALAGAQTTATHAAPKYLQCGQNVRIAADISETRGTTRKLPQSDENDHHGAEVAATIKIWLIILAFPLVIIAAIISNILDIIKERRDKALKKN